MGIEPTSSAWEAEVLPLNNTREALPSNYTRPDPTCSIIIQGQMSHNNQQVFLQLEPTQALSSGLVSAQQESPAC